MSNSETGQVTRNAAEVYEEFFLPAIFGLWAPRVADAAAIRPGLRVLDVACGTGVLAREVAERMGAAGMVAGVDINDGMLTVARRTAPAIEWRRAPAEALPFENDSFDAVVSQFGLMYFEDRHAALSEMRRVLRPTGRLVVAVWASLDELPGYATLVGLLQRLFGEQIAEAKRAPFVLGDRALLRSLFAEAGMADAQITTQRGMARFPSVASWLHTEIRGWTLADALDDAQFDLLLREAERAMRPFVTDDGAIVFETSAHTVTATGS